ncbi:Ig-like domain protein [Escherichia phage Ioannina]|nr:Ig-like domain protein [Escherichia phage Ioannina]
MLKSILDHNADALDALAKTDDAGARRIIANTISHAGVFGASLPGPKPDVKVSSATVTVTPEEVTIGTKSKATVAVQPAGATDKSGVWISGSPTIATVDASGNIDGKTPGSVDIIWVAKDGSGVSGRKTVTVANAE